MQLAFLCSLGIWECIHVQSSHLRALLSFVDHSTTTHLLMAVSSVVDGGLKKKRNVLHCYALIWSRTWNIVHIDGTVNPISFSRHHQPLPELQGATVVQLFCLTASATTRFDVNHGNL